MERTSRRPDFHPRTGGSTGPVSGEPSLPTELVTYSGRGTGSCTATDLFPSSFCSSRRPTCFQIRVSIGTHPGEGNEKNVWPSHPWTGPRETNRPSWCTGTSTPWKSLQRHHSTYKVPTRTDNSSVFPVLVGREIDLTPRPVTGHPTGTFLCPKDN